MNADVRETRRRMEHEQDVRRQSAVESVPRKVRGGSGTGAHGPAGGGRAAAGQAQWTGPGDKEAS